MTHTMFTKALAAGLIVMVAAAARAQGVEENTTFTKLQIPQITPTNTVAHTLDRPVAAAEFGSLPPAWPSEQQHAGTQSSSRNSRSRQAWSGVALGLMGLIVGASMGEAIDRQCHCGGDSGIHGAVGASVGATLGATFGVRLGR
jgi:hypothetical protein